MSSGGMVASDAPTQNPARSAPIAVGALPPRRRRRRGFLRAFLFVLLLAGASGVYAVHEGLVDRASIEKSVRAWGEPPPAPPPPVINQIVVRGRLEPSDGVYQVAAFSIAPTIAVGQLLVTEGQQVSKNDVVATLRSHGQATAGVETAKAMLAAMERRLDLTRRPYKEAAIAAQQATVQARQADLALAQAQMQRGDQLHERGILSSQTRDMRTTEVTRARAHLEEARAQLNATVEVPTREVALAEAEVASARARLHAAYEELALTEIRAPTNGTVLKIHAKAGELVSARQIMDIGNIDSPKVIAEVDERLVPQLKVGQKIRVSMRGSDREWDATLIQIGGVVIAQMRPSTDTVTGQGGRIVEVEAAIQDTSGLPPIAGLELLVRIQLQ